MSNRNIIGTCHVYLHVQYASSNTLHLTCDWQRISPSQHMQKQAIFFHLLLKFTLLFLYLNIKTACEHDFKIPQSHTADLHMTP